MHFNLIQVAYMYDNPSKFYLEMSPIMVNHYEDIYSFT